MLANARSRRIFPMFLRENKRHLVQISLKTKKAIPRRLQLPVHSVIMVRT